MQNWHEQIQRYLDGQSTAEEAHALAAALQTDAELRALYLDYLNLDAALRGLAARAEEQAPAVLAAHPAAVRRPWRWLAASAAAAAVLALAWAFLRPAPAPKIPPEWLATLEETQRSIARLPASALESPPSLAASPTASLLAPPVRPL
ncbi:MAG: hypothetical protein JSR82_12765 [Verrucomicrobia bacterium]|nr:hypothetical protein [Verrucomicrobiota bacterium]